MSFIEALVRLRICLLRYGQWPCDWKKGDWTPVYKKEDKNAKENYTPVTVLSCVNKVFEHLLGNQVTTK